MDYQSIRNKEIKLILEEFCRDYEEDCFNDRVRLDNCFTWYDKDKDKNDKDIEKIVEYVCLEDRKILIECNTKVLFEKEKRRIIKLFKQEIKNKTNKCPKCLKIHDSFLHECREDDD
jgi:hypothetical protein